MRNDLIVQVLQKKCGVGIDLWQMMGEELSSTLYCAIIVFSLLLDWVFKSRGISTGHDLSSHNSGKGGTGPRLSLIVLHAFKLLDIYNFNASHFEPSDLKINLAVE